MAANSLPLFFKNPQALHNERHKNAGIRQNQGMDFARKTNSIIITSAEFAEAAKHYPIVFTDSDPTSAVVIVGLENENYFVDGKGKWQDNTYIPAYVRQFPFVFHATPDSDQLILCIDEGAGLFTNNAGDKDAVLFEKDGKPSALTQSALEFCNAVRQQHVYTQSFFDAVKDLFIPQNMEATLASGRKLTMSGFRALDQEKLRSLPDERITDLHKKGFLALLYFISLSMSNLPRLLQMAEKANKS